MLVWYPAIDRPAVNASIVSENIIDVLMFIFTSKRALYFRCWRLDETAATVVVVVVLRLAHRYNAVRGHRTGSNNSGAEDYDYLRRKTNKKQNTHDN